MKINLSGPDFTQADIDAVVAVMRTDTLSMGLKLPQFEAALAQYVGRKHGVAVNSSASALHLSLLALGIGPGDEVIIDPWPTKNSQKPRSTHAKNDCTRRR